MASSKNFYAGIGSRETPRSILDEMILLATKLSASGWILRSGGAIGADSAFELGAGTNKEIWIPFKGYNGIQTGKIPNDEYFYLASKVHPVYDRLSRVTKALHARNCGQILGEDSSNPSKFVICWTKDGAETISEVSRETGGTGTAIKVACLHNIPVINIKNDDWESRLLLLFAEQGLTF